MKFEANVWASPLLPYIFMCSVYKRADENVFSIQACSKSILNSERHLLGSLTNCVPEVYKKSVNVVCVCACMGMHECVHMVLDMQLSSQSVSKKV